ncbi:unnamed protein product [Spodoptera exigua]|nr:unnamed protein product [Spodoptera exigua]
MREVLSSLRSRRRGDTLDKAGRLSPEMYPTRQYSASVCPPSDSLGLMSTSGLGVQTQKCIALSWGRRNQNRDVCGGDGGAPSVTREDTFLQRAATKSGGGAPDTTNRKRQRGGAGGHLRRSRTTAPPHPSLSPHSQPTLTWPAQEAAPALAGSWQNRCVSKVGVAAVGSATRPHVPLTSPASARHVCAALPGRGLTHCSACKKACNRNLTFIRVRDCAQLFIKEGIHRNTSCIARQRLRPARVATPHVMALHVVQSAHAHTQATCLTSPHAQCPDAGTSNVSALGHYAALSPRGRARCCLRTSTGPWTCPAPAPPDLHTQAPPSALAIQHPPILTEAALAERLLLSADTYSTQLVATQLQYRLQARRLRWRIDVIHVVMLELGTELLSCWIIDMARDLVGQGHGGCGGCGGAGRGGQRTLIGGATPPRAGHRATIDLRPAGHYTTYTALLQLNQQNIISQADGCDHEDNRGAAGAQAGRGARGGSIATQEFNLVAERGRLRAPRKLILIVVIREQAGPAPPRPRPRHYGR